MNKLFFIPKYLKKNKLLTVLAVIFLLIRLPFLSQQFLLHDERDIVFSGYTIAKLGEDLMGNPFPLSFADINPKTPFVSIYSVALWWIIMPIKSVFTARLFFVLFTTTLVFLVYEVVQTLTKKRAVSIMTTVMFIFSPWMFHMTSLALEANLALTFVLAGMLCFFREKKFWTYLFFGLAFFSYQGYRILIPPLLFYMEFYYMFVKNLKLIVVIKRAIIPIVFITLLFTVSFRVDGNITSNRMSELVFFNYPYLSSDVYVKRATSLAPQSLQRIIHNKATSAMDHMLDRLVLGIGPDHLFKKGDPSPIYGSTSGGQFFLFFLPILLIGVVVGLKDRTGWYIMGFIVIGMIPSLVSTVNTTFAIRSSFSVIGYAYLLATGTLVSIKFIRKLDMKIQRIAMVLTGIIIVIHVIYFGYNYHYRRPITVGELFFENERQLAEYLINHPQSIDLVYHKRPNESYLSYYFLDNSLSISKIKADFANNSTQIAGDTSFVNCDIHKNAFTNLTKSRIIFEECLTPHQNQKYSNDPLIEKIPYRDFSFKTAYFIVPSK